MFNSFGQFCNGFSSLGRFHTGGIFMMGIGLVLVLAIGYFLFKKRSFIESDNSETPLDLLQKRYVNGEIKEEEYLSKKATLGKLK